jgi:hypothetical protein
MRNLLIAAAAIMALSAAPAFAAGGGGGGGGTDNPATGAVREASYSQWNGAGSWRQASREAAATRFAALQQRPGYLDAPEHLGGGGH